MTLTKDVRQTLTNLKSSGVRFNIITEVQSDIGNGRTVRRVELHHYYTRLNGQEQGHFVAEMDLYGQITAWGRFMTAPKRIVRQFNADGDEIK